MPNKPPFDFKGPVVDVHVGTTRNPSQENFEQAVEALRDIADPMYRRAALIGIIASKLQSDNLPMFDTELNRVSLEAEFDVLWKYAVWKGVVDK